MRMSDSKNGPVNKLVNDSTSENYWLMILGQNPNLSQLIQGHCSDPPKVKIIEEQSLKLYSVTHLHV